jgi:hypothetical protein
VGFLFDDLRCCFSNSELQDLSAGVLERNKGYYNTSQGRPDGSGGGYTYSSRGGNTGGRWDTRSSGSSDRDGELPDRDSQTQGKFTLLFVQRFALVFMFLKLAVYDLLLV